MTNVSLALAYLRKASDRLELLDILERKGAYSDVMREAQEIVELALKGMLRYVGIEPPKFHDVGGLLLDHRDRYPEWLSDDLPRMAEISKKLRKERELSFYGDIDFIPTEEYGPEDAASARQGAQLIVLAASRLMEGAP